MPVIQDGPYFLPILIHEAPVNEKTKAIRERFKVDEKTGYPEHYNWRAMARLGPEYRPEDLYTKLDPFDPKEEISTQVFLVGATGLGVVGLHCLTNYYTRKPMWSGIPRTTILGAVAIWISLKAHDMVLTRQGIKNAIFLDYLKKHPDRFETVKRYKHRELLFDYCPRR